MIANPQDSLQLFQEAFELGMVGKGWTWIGSDGAVSTMFSRSQNLQRAMEGMIGFRPQPGSGPLFESLYDEWLRVDHSADRQVCTLFDLFLGLRSCFSCICYQPKKISYQKMIL